MQRFLKWKHYFPVYQRHFGKFVNTDVIFIEIGCGVGGSLQMWKRFFGPRARIIGIDINPACRAFSEDKIEVCIGDQSDPAVEEALYDSLAMRRFVGIDLGREPVPAYSGGSRPPIPE